MNKLSKKLIVRFLISELILIVALPTAFAVGKYLCSLIVWMPSNPIYIILSSLGNAYIYIEIAFILFGSAAITAYFLHKTVAYTREVTDAVSLITSASEVPIELSPDLHEAELDLNTARETALRNIYSAKEAEQRKNDLIVYLAHDLKTPLTSVMGYLSLLKDEPQMSEEMRVHYTDIAVKKSERLETLINEFFEITRFNLTHIELQKETIDLKLMLEQIASEFSPSLIANNLTMKTDFSHVRLCCDAEKLERVFDNLLSNAVSYCADGDEIFTSLYEENGTAVFRVQNPGPTIPSEKLERIFEQFYRLDSSRATSHGGAGLGLAIAKEIVTLHGGTITAQSENETVTFTVRLPL